MRRSTRTPLTETFKFGDVKVDFTKMELWRDGTWLQFDFARVQGAEVHDPERGARAIA